jgi:very-short-patch-repair endonuclease
LEKGEWTSLKKEMIKDSHHLERTKKKISKAQKGKHHSEETKKKMSEKNKGKFIGKKSSLWRGGMATIICEVCGKKKDNISLSHIKRGQGKFCSLRCSTISNNIHQKNHDTNIERLIENELIRRNIPYTKQIPLLGITIVDFLLPQDIVIYADGDYWHSLPKAKTKDLNQDFILTFHRYKVFRFTETEIKKSVKKCIDKIKWEGIWG